MMTGSPLGRVLAEAERTLAAAGVTTPGWDARALAAHVLHQSPDTLSPAATLAPDAAARFAALVARRAERVPLEHLTGRTVFGGIELEVGPGVFLPRPQSEPMLRWGISFLTGLERPVVVDLCAGSGALALALAHARPDAVVHAIDHDEDSVGWARRNAARRAAAGDTPVQVSRGDVADDTLLADLAGRADLVLCNPPYKPAGVRLQPEYRDHQPGHALFGGETGLTVIDHAVHRATALLGPGGGFVIEHDDRHAESVPALLRDTGCFTEVADHPDTDGRARYATARRSGL